MQPSSAKGMIFRPEVLRAEPKCELRWLGHQETCGNSYLSNKMRNHGNEYGSL